MEISFVFQSVTLFPAFTAEEDVLWPLGCRTMAVTSFLCAAPV